MIIELNILGDENLHNAEADAYNTMLVFKAILNNKSMSFQELCEWCPEATA